MVIRVTEIDLVLLWSDAQVLGVIQYMVCIGTSETNEDKTQLLLKCSNIRQMLGSKNP